MSHFTDRSDVGFFPLQHHESNIPIDLRQAMAGGRLTSVGDSTTPSNSLKEYGRENGLGTLGDLHPWGFWQEATQGARGCGSWSMAWSGLTMGGGTGGLGKGRGRTSTPLRASQLVPMRDEKATMDGRFTVKEPGWPKSFNSIPQGTMMMVMPGTEENAQNDLMLHADPRLVAANTEGPGEAGTLVVDLQGEGTMCMRGEGDDPDDAEEPGIVGRAARLQSMMRVIPLGPSSLAAIPGMGRGNGIAWNLSRSSQDGLAGYGMSWVEMEGGGGGGGTRPDGGVGPWKGDRGGTVGGPIDPPGGGGKSGGGGGDPYIGHGPFKRRWGRAPNPPGGGGPYIGHGPFKRRWGPGPGAWKPSGKPYIGHGPYNRKWGTPTNKPPGTGGKAPGGPRGRKDPLGMYWPGHGDGGGGGGPASNGDNPDGFGNFEAKRAPQNGTTLVAHVPTFGPITGGAGKGDKHHIGNDKDGNPITSGHISTDGYFFHDADMDGPLLFEPDPYPEPGHNPLMSRVHLVWDSAEKHDWIQGQKDGKWRWYAEYHVVIPTDVPKDTPPVDTPKTGGPGVPVPSGPTTPGPGKPGGPGSGQPSGPYTPGGGSTGGPITHGKPAVRGGGSSIPPWNKQPGGGGSTTGSEEGGGNFLGSRFGGPSSSIGHVGGTSPGDQSLFLLHHPMMESFAEMAWRPQLMHQGGQSFVHNPRAPAADYQADEATRPQVLASRSWGAQNDSGTWNYAAPPTASRARGGTVSGGVLFTPPIYEMEDYLGINSAVDVHASPTTGYLMCAPGAGFALGTPNTDGGLAAKSVTIAQVAGASGNQKLEVRQLDSTRTSVMLIDAEVDQSSDDVVVAIGGNQAMRIPRGTSAQRPADTVTTGLGEFFRANTDVASGEDILEYYDQQTLEWKQIVASTTGGGTPVEVQQVEFSATGSFSYGHGRGTQPVVVVTDSSGHEIEVCVQHPSVNTVTVSFIGTLTSAVLILD